MGKHIDKDIAIKELIELRYKKGYSTQMLTKYLMDTYKLKQARSYELIREMKAEIGSAYHNTNENLLEDTVEFLETMKAEAIKMKNHKLALEWQKEIDKVQQLHIQKLEIEAKSIEGITINIKKTDD